MRGESTQLDSEKMLSAFLNDVTDSSFSGTVCESSESPFSMPAKPFWWGRSPDNTGLSGEWSAYGIAKQNSFDEYIDSSTRSGFSSQLSGEQTTAEGNTDYTEWRDRNRKDVNDKRWMAEKGLTIQAKGDHNTNAASGNDSEGSNKDGILHYRTGFSHSMMDQFSTNRETLLPSISQYCSDGTVCGEYKLAHSTSQLYTPRSFNQQDEILNAFGSGSSEEHVVEALTALLAASLSLNLQRHSDEGSAAVSLGSNDLFVSGERQMKNLASLFNHDVGRGYPRCCWTPDDASDSPVSKSKTLCEKVSNEIYLPTVKSAISCHNCETPFSWNSSQVSPCNRRHICGPSTNLAIGGPQHFFRQPPEHREARLSHNAKTVLDGDALGSGVASRCEKRAKSFGGTRATRSLNNWIIPENNLFVFHVPPEWNEEEFRKQFSLFGPIRRLGFPTDSSTPWGHKGYGFVCYEHFDDADRARRAMDGREVKEGRRLKVEVKK